MFVDRVDGIIVATYVSRQREGQEEVADAHPDVVAFNARLTAIVADDGSRTLLQRRAKELDRSDDITDQIASLKIRLQLLGG